MARNQSKMYRRQPIPKRLQPDSANPQRVAGVSPCKGRLIRELRFGFDVCVERLYFGEVL